jgi:hypothetical protein
MPVAAKLSRKLSTPGWRRWSRMAGFETRIIRWMFVFWVGTLGTIIALLNL